MSDPFYSWDGEDLILKVRLQPGARRDEVTGIHGDSLKVRVTAPPTEGRANARLAKFLARELGAAKGAVSVEKGQKGKDKVLRLAGVTAEGFAAARKRWGI